MNEWYQQSLTMPEVLELNTRIGLIPSTDHLQVLVELKDPVTNVLIAQWSMPHARLDSWQHAIALAATKAEEFLALNLEPF